MTESFWPKNPYKELPEPTYPYKGRLLEHVKARIWKECQAADKEAVRPLLKRCKSLIIEYSHLQDTLEARALVKLLEEALGYDREVRTT